MPDPISSASRSSCEICDPSSASCLDAPSAPPKASNVPSIVTIAPVVIKGDAGAQELASLACGKELRSVHDCNETNDSLRASAAEVVADCHERDGTVKSGASPNEVICEVEP
ncbi:MAG TPA: hypothetical protein VER04_07665 [Polyangiaceae bacterium]|nr:hypothetical protein [Polyangiaceae bacterium]